MKHILELKQKRSQVIADARLILDKARTENRKMNEDEETRWNDLMTKADEMKGQIEIEERQYAADQEMDKLDSTGFKANPEERALDVRTKERIEDKPWESFGEQLLAVVRAAQPGGKIDPRLTTRSTSGLSESVPSGGGFLVMKDFSNELLKNTYETGQILSRCKRIPISSNSNGIKINGINENSRKNGSRMGGIQAFWENEADEIKGSKPKFRVLELNLKKLTALCYATDELLQDAVALEALIRSEFPNELAFKTEDAVINGSGAGEPLGILNSKSLVVVAKEQNQAAETVVAKNIAKMWSRMWARSRANAVWLINQDVEPQLSELSIAVGTGGLPVYLPPGGLSQSPYSTLYGRPVIPVEYGDTVGELGDIVLADFSTYLLADKEGIKSDVSIHVRFINDESVFRFIYRVDGQPSWHVPLMPYKGKNTISPFVALEKRN